MNLNYRRIRAQWGHRSHKHYHHHDDHHNHYHHPHHHYHAHRHHDGNCKLALTRPIMGLGLSCAASSESCESYAAALDRGLSGMGEGASGLRPHAYYYRMPRAGPLGNCRRGIELRARGRRRHRLHTKHSSPNCRVRLQSPDS